MAIELVDIGVNLAHDSFHSDRAEVIERARSVGVTRLIVTGTSVPASRDALSLARNHKGALFATAGIHPHHASEYEVGSLEALKELAADDCVVAIGECGLDFFRDFSPRDAQRAAFRDQLALAAECRLPVFLHQREAHEELARIVSEYRDSLVGGVSHCFTGDLNQLRAYIDLDLHIGITGWVCDERRGAELRAAVPHIPLERLLLETDAPYLLPRDIDPKPRSRRNEPSFLPHILDRVSELMALDREVVAAASTRNADALFGLSLIRR
jgi:TatD DNase family protein